MAQEGDQKQGGRRLTRLIIFALAVALIVLVGRPILANLPTASNALPKSRLTALIEEKALRVLGEKSLPDLTASGGEPEPITAPVDNINRQAQDLLEAVKALPQDQIEAAKKQLCKEICGGCQATGENTSVTIQSEPAN